MKIRQLNETPEEFKPIELVFTIESKRELETLWCIFNAAPVAVANFLNDASRSTHDIKDFSATEICQNKNRSQIWRFFDDIIRNK